MEKITNRLILLRHAHRHMGFDYGDDNGISELGEKQANVLAKYFFKKFGETPSVKLLSSPATRCVETLAPIANELDLTVEIEQDLFEQRSRETEHEFTLRLEQFINSWHYGKAQLTIAVTHGDWLPVCIYNLFSINFNYGNACWIELVIDNEKLCLVKTLQCEELEEN